MVRVAEDISGDREHVSISRRTLHTTRESAKESAIAYVHDRLRVRAWCECADSVTRVDMSLVATPLSSSRPRNTTDCEADAGVAMASGCVERTDSHMALMLQPGL